jgi:hypothetical protein
MGGAIPCIQTLCNDNGWLAKRKAVTGWTLFPASAFVYPVDDAWFRSCGACAIVYGGEGVANYCLTDIVIIYICHYP